MFLIILMGILIVCFNVVLQAILTVYSLKFLHKFNARKTKISIKELLLQISLSVTILTFVHAIQCVVWATAYFANPEIDNLFNFMEAFYFSLITFTTVGYGDVTINGEWKILAGIEAINGIMMVGWSTALMFSYIQIILRKNIAENK